VSLTAWRIVAPKYAEPLAAFSGEGAKKTSGRWNSKGVAMAYTSATPSLAILEMRANVLPDPDLIYILLPIRFPKDLVETITAKELPTDWKSQPAPQSLKHLGDEWTRSRRCAVLKVPSVLLEIEWNYLINPGHSAFPGQFAFGEAVEFRFDSRLV